MIVEMLLIRSSQEPFGSVTILPLIPSIVNSLPLSPTSEFSALMRFCLLLPRLDSDLLAAGGVSSARRFLLFVLCEAAGSFSFFTDVLAAGTVLRVLAAPNTGFPPISS